MSSETDDEHANEEHEILTNPAQRSFVQLQRL
jgi:hypothetical protein